TEGHQREFLRIATALDRDRANGASHPGAAEQVHAVRRFGDVEPDGGSNLIGERPPRLLGVEPETARQALWMEISETDIGVGECPLAPPLMEGAGPGPRPRAPGPHVQSPGGAAPHDPPPARPDFGNVDGRHAEEKAAAPVETASLGHASADLE